jgi:hypothetical protein
METIYASFTCINVSSEKMSQYMEIASNIQTKNFGLNVRRNGLQPTIFVRSFSQITTSLTARSSLSENRTTEIDQDPVLRCRVHQYHSW